MGRKEDVMTRNEIIRKKIAEKLPQLPAAPPPARRVPSGKGI
jgi:hypothetical protein